MRIIVFGSSVCLTIRPPRTTRAEGTYTDLLRRACQAQDPTAEVLNLARRSNIITLESELEFTNSLTRFNPDVVILHYGIVEASPRALPYRSWMWWHRPQVCSKFKGYIAGRLNLLWPHLIRLFGLKGWVNSAQFAYHLKRLCAHARKECQARIFLINIGPPNELFCQRLPGIERIIPEYNRTIARVAAEEGAEVIDVWSLIQQYSIEKMQPDGAHLTSFGHECLFQQLWLALQQSADHESGVVSEIRS